MPSSQRMTRTATIVQIKLAKSPPPLHGPDRIWPRFDINDIIYHGSAITRSQGSNGGRRGVGAGGGPALCVRPGSGDPAEEGRKGFTSESASGMTSTERRTAHTG